MPYQKETILLVRRNGPLCVYNLVFRDDDSSRTSLSLSRWLCMLCCVWFNGTESRTHNNVRWNNISTTRTLPWRCSRSTYVWIILIFCGIVCDVCDTIPYTIRKCYMSSLVNNVQHFLFLFSWFYCLNNAEYKLRNEKRQKKNEKNRLWKLWWIQTIIKLLLHTNYIVDIIMERRLPHSKWFFEDIKLVWSRHPHGSHRSIDTNVYKL